MNNCRGAFKSTVKILGEKKKSVKMINGYQP